MNRRVAGSDRDALAVEGRDQTIAREVDDHPIKVPNDLGKLAQQERDYPPVGIGIARLQLGRADKIDAQSGERDLRADQSGQRVLRRLRLLDRLGVLKGVADFLRALLKL